MSNREPLSSPMFDAERPPTSPAGRTPGREDSPPGPSALPFFMNASGAGAAAGGAMESAAANIFLKAGLDASERYLRQGRETLLPRWLDSLRFYFMVSNEYVRSKLQVILFPFGRTFRRQRAVDTISPDLAENGGDPGVAGFDFLPASADVNGVDLYLPAMALVTFVILSTTARGLFAHVGPHGAEPFRPDVLFQDMSSLLMVIAVEVSVLYGAAYVAAMGDIFALDAVAWVGYKFVPLAVATLLRLVLALAMGPGSYVALLVTLLTCAPFAYFLIETLRANAGSVGSAEETCGPTQKTYFVYVAGAVQLPLMMWLASRAV
eukprot:TRINITY_DN13779_c0_g1_i1.p1 TRINITY_DN13779_c0_g1~~TRINITY_DN13779_c0_g1_i1.p1  ORF type:complete len:321 (+),score=45.86 TRINITY_DN13779_c0_g1_i1:94-1056(+)